MDIEFAKRIVDASKAHGKELITIVREAHDLLPEAEYLTFRRSIAEVMGTYFHELLTPALNQHPSLWPELTGSQRTSPDHDNQ